MKQYYAGTGENMDLTGLIIGLSIGVLWLVGCCLLIHSIGIKKRRTTLYVIAVILFIVCVGAFGVMRVGSAAAKNAVRENAVLLDEYIKEEYNNVQLVRSGVDITEVPQAINDLEAIVPRSISEFGLSDIILESLYKKALNSVFVHARATTDVIVRFATEDGRVTSSTIIKAAEYEINQTIGRIVFWNSLINSIILAIFLCVCIILSVRKNGETVVYGKTE
jgi:ABC-type maltose transport system permease subunit